jgi:hypothetical protein
VSAESIWPEPLRWIEAARFTPSAPLKRRIIADDAARTAIAKQLDLKSLDALSADLAVSGWFDGVSIEGRLKATITQICGVSLEAFSTDIDARFALRAVPTGSAQATTLDSELVIDLDADDPPDVLEGDGVDLGGYVIEHLALEIDPFPRKPGVEFVAPAPSVERSPFEVLIGFKDREPPK